MSSARMRMGLAYPDNQVRTTMPRKVDTRSERTRKPGRWIMGTIVISVVILGGFAVFRSLQRPPSTGDAIAALKNSASALSVPTHVGQPAPKLTAMGVDGQPYTVMPGDGRPKVIVFYMGFG